MNKFKKYEITFTSKKNKYSPTTRTIIVEAQDELSATRLVHLEHGSFTMNKEKGIFGGMMIPTNKIIIDSVKEVEDFKKNIEQKNKKSK